MLFDRATRSGPALKSFGGMLRSRLAVAAVVVASLGLAACQPDGPYSAKHLQPLSREMLADIERKGMDKHSPLLVRVFKEESELEVWKQDRSGRYALLKTYPICRWSGQLGPKVREGDRQAPEGFYAITPGQMNPNSSFYLSFNLGYPNAFDRAHGRTGAHLMVHGDCSSAGCYSMTDEQVAEIFALGREAFFGGQRSFQVQAYPFRMTPRNMARHRNNPHMAFWRNLKEGYDHFEVSRQEPRVNVCERRYVFNAQSRDGSPLSFNPTGRCPDYEVPADIASLVAEKTRIDRQETQALTRRVAAAPISTGRDGDMHPAFRGHYATREVRDARGNVRGVEVTKLEASRPIVFRQPAEPPMWTPALALAASPVTGADATAAAGATGSVAATASAVPMPRPVPGRGLAGAPRTSTASAYAGPQAAASSGSGDGGNAGRFFNGLYQSSVDAVGKVFGQEPRPHATAAPSRAAATTGSAARPNRPATATAAASRNPPTPPTRTQAGALPPQRPQAATESPSPAQTVQAAPQRPAAAAGLIGAQPVVPAGSFEGRWGSGSR